MSPSPQRTDRILSVVLHGCSAIAGVIVLLVFVFLVRESLPVLTGIGPAAFFAPTTWHPTDGLYNLMPMLWGSLAAMIGAVALAAPLGICAAIYCHYYATPRLAHLLRRFIELLAGIPSVVYGLWGLVVLVPLINRMAPPGASLCAGIIILMLMILPTIALIADATLTNVPSEYLRAAVALGISRGSRIRRVALPTAWPGLATGVILGAGRAIGETMAVLMVCGNVVQTPTSLFDPIRTLTANIALEMAYALDHHRSALFVSGLVLMAIITILIFGADRIKRERAF